MSEYIFSADNLREVFPESKDFIGLCEEEGAVPFEELKNATQLFPHEAVDLLHTLNGILRPDVIGITEREMSEELVIVEKMMQVFREENAELRRMLPLVKLIPDFAIPLQIRKTGLVQYLKEGRVWNLKTPHDSFFKYMTALCLTGMYSTSPVSTGYFSKRALYIFGVQDHDGFVQTVFPHDFLHPGKATEYGTPSNLRSLLDLFLSMENLDESPEIMQFLQGAKNLDGKGNHKKIAQKKVDRTMDILNQEYVVEFDDVRKVFFDTRLVPQFNLDTLRFINALFQHIRFTVDEQRLDAAHHTEIGASRAIIVNHFINLNQTYLQSEAAVMDMFNFVFNECGFAPLMQKLGIKDVQGFMNGLLAEVQAYFKIKARNPEFYISAGGEIDRLGADLVVFETDQEGNQKPVELVQVKNDVRAQITGEFSLDNLPMEVEAAISQNGRRLTTKEIQNLKTNIMTKSTLSPSERVLRTLFQKEESKGNKYDYQRLQKEIDTMVKLVYEAKKQGCNAIWMITNVDYSIA